MLALSDPRETDITFADPGDLRSLGQTLSDLYSVDDSTRALMAGGTGAASLEEMQANAARFRAGFSAAEKQTRLVDTVNAHDSALEQAAQNRIDTVKRLTGVELENPFDGGYAAEANIRVDERGVFRAARAVAVAEEARNIFHERLDQVAQEFPQHAEALQFYQSLDDQARAISQAAAGEFTRTDPDFIPAIIGGLWGSRRDPLFLASLFAGPGLSTAKTVIGRIGMGALNQGLYNAGLQALAQPAVQAWRRDIGEKNGVWPAVENVGMAFLFGAIPGAAIEGARALTGPGKEALVRISTGQPQAGDVAHVAGELGLPLEREAQGVIAAAERDGTDAVRVTGPPPAGVAAADHAELVAQATRFAEDPSVNPPPELPVVASTRPRDQARVVDEALPATLGERDTVDGKPVEFMRFDPADLQTDAARFQYKGGGDAAGVTDRLRFVTQWDPLASGKALVWERADGVRFIADGHQRLALARRLSESDASTRLDGFLFRAADGWTPEDVRAIAAKKNMQEGSGTALDAAQVLRDRPDLLDGSLPVTSPTMKNAVALARLSDEAWGLARNGLVPENQAAAVGGMVADRLQHAAVIADLARYKPETDREARVLIGEIMAAGFRTEQQISLFGAADATRSLMGDRVKVLDAALSALLKDRRLFGTLADKADAIEAAGNQLARAGNAARARDAAALSDMLMRLAQRTGPASDALNRAAARRAEGLSAAKAADGFLDEVRALLDRDGLAGLLAAPELKPAQAVEPATTEALAVARTAHGERQESMGAPGSRSASETAAAAIGAPEASLPPEGGLFDRAARDQTDLFDAVAVGDDKGNFQLKSEAAALEDADKSAQHADLVKSCKD